MFFFACPAYRYAGQATQKCCSWTPGGMQALRSRKNPFYWLTLTDCRILQQVPWSCILPRLKYGKSNYAPVVNRWYYTATAFYTQVFTCYDTRQILTVDSAPYTLLSSRQLHQWYGEGARFIIGKLINPPKKPQLEAKKLLPRPKHPLVKKIMKLPLHKRIEFFQRFEACGAFNR